MDVKLLAIFSVAAVLAAGCERIGDGVAQEEPQKPGNSFFVAFDAVGVTNVNLAAVSNITLAYASLDGSGEWRRIFDPSEASTAEDALAYIERTCTRCGVSDKNILLRLYLKETRLPGIDSHGDFDVWHVVNDLFLVVESEPGSPANILACDFVICDGRALRRLVPFATLPASDTVWDCVRQSRDNPAALNNVAAMLFNDVALRSAVSAEHINFLLLLAAGAGEPIACRNLALFYASSLATDEDKDYKRDFWLRRTSEAVLEKQQGFKPVLEARAIEEWPR